jgi:hypothetical protein
MNDEWEEIGANSLAVATLVSTLDSGYEYKVMRRKVKSEREQFIDYSTNLCFGAGSRAAFGFLYDGGARFK